MTAFGVLARRLAGIDACVCGHPEADHREGVMSVPLTPKEPAYKIPSSMFNNIACSHPNATYTRQECHCGCTSYERDTGRK